MPSCSLNNRYACFQYTKHSSEGPIQQTPRILCKPSTFRIEILAMHCNRYIYIFWLCHRNDYSVPNIKKNTQISLHIFMVLKSLDSLFIYSHGVYLKTVGALTKLHTCAVLPNFFFFLNMRSIRYIFVLQKFNFFFSPPICNG